MKKIIICAIILAIGLFLVFRHTVTFVWVNPYTYTKGYSHISKTLREIDKGLKIAQKYSAQDGKVYKYIFQNAYGSGFLNNNPIPNDLDYSVGVYLGEYIFDGTNSEEIARTIVDKMESFQYLFNYYVNTSSRSLYIDKSSLQVLGVMSHQRKNNIKAISENLKQAISGKEYIKHTIKKSEDGFEMDLPYVMRANEILIENYDPIMLYSDMISYNPEMPRYIRSISIIPEFFMTIKSEDTSDQGQLIEIVPESFMGERMQLSRRFFASSTFTGNNSKKFLKNLSYINDDEEYLYYRMLSFKRHLQEISNISVMKDRPVKMLKRVMQTADIVSPLIDNDTMNEISETVFKNMNNEDIKLLNEYSNICSTLLQLQEHPNLFLRLLAEGKVKNMHDVLLSVVNKMDERGNIKDIDKLRFFAEKTLNKMFLMEDQKEVLIFKKIILEEQYKDISYIINVSIYSLIQDKDKLDKYTSIFNKIYADAGYHRVSLYWLDENTIGILKDDFTKNIKDLNKFAKENELADVNYKLVEKTQIPMMTVKYAIWARYNPSGSEQENYENMNKAFLEDKKNFNIKLKFAF